MMQDATQTQAPEPAHRPGSKILKSQDFEALSSARHGIEQARTEAEGVIAAAHEQAEAIRVAARADAEAEHAALIAEYAGRMNGHLSRTQEALVGVVMSSLRRLLDPVPDAEKVAGAVACALDETDIAGGAVLIVAPPLMHTLREQFEKRGIRPDVIEVRGDPDCPIESSVLRSSFGDVELGIEFQLRAIERGLRSAATGNDAP